MWSRNWYNYLTIKQLVPWARRQSRPKQNNYKISAKKFSSVNLFYYISTVIKT